MTADFADRYGPVAVVTGASSGIGCAFAEELASRGLDLVVTARRLGRLEELAARLARQHGVAVTPWRADLADPGAPRQLVEFTAGMDVGLVISNAGFGLRRAPHEAHDPAALTALLMVNCHAPSALAHGFIPRLRARGKGGIVFTSSVEGALGGPYSAAYSSSKAMVTALGEALWGELAGSGVDVLTLCPGKTVSEAMVKQGFDPSMLDDAMPAREVARLALDHIADGPTYISSEYYAAMIERMSALPRRQALLASAAAMKQHMAARDASLFSEGQVKERRQCPGLRGGQGILVVTYALQAAGTGGCMASRPQKLESATCQVPLVSTAWPFWPLSIGILERGRLQVTLAVEPLTVTAVTCAAVSFHVRRHSR